MSSARLARGCSSAPVTTPAPSATPPSPPPPAATAAAAADPPPSPAVATAPPASPGSAAADAAVGEPGVFLPAAPVRASSSRIPAWMAALRARFPSSCWRALRSCRKSSVCHWSSSDTSSTRRTARARSSATLSCALRTNCALSSDARTPPSELPSPAHASEIPTLPRADRADATSLAKAWPSATSVRSLPASALGASSAAAERRGARACKVAASAADPAAGARVCPPNPSPRSPPLVRSGLLLVLTPKPEAVPAPNPPPSASPCAAPGPNVRGPLDLPTCARPNASKRAIAGLAVGTPAPAPALAPVPSPAPAPAPAPDPACSRRALLLVLTPGSLRRTAVTSSAPAQERHRRDCQCSGKQFA